MTKLISVLASETISIELLPIKLQEEFISFVLRNAVVQISNVKQINSSYPCCARCLKAHLLKKARTLKNKEYKMSNVNDMINRIFMEEAGHYGYYLDKGNLIKI